MTLVKKHDDIDVCIEKLEIFRDAPDNKKYIKELADHYAGSIISLLNELKDKRDEHDRQKLALIDKGAHRVIVEGFSTKDFHDAFSNALSKVIHYFSEQHDVSVTVLGLLELPKGGYRATLEIHLTPVSFNETEHPEGMDLELNKTSCT
jgi:hypothetical protein